MTRVEIRFKKFTADSLKRLTDKVELDEDGFPAIVLEHVETDFVVIPRCSNRRLDMFLRICQAVAEGKKVRIMRKDGTSNVYDETNIDDLYRKEFGDNEHDNE